MNQAKDCNGEGGSDQDSEDYHLSAKQQFEQAFLSEHGQNVEDVVMVVDPNMDYDSDNESEYEHHISDTENVTEHLKNVFMCKYCDKAYIAKDECRAHETTAHNNEIPFQCTDCDMGFADRTNYTAHQKSVHGNDKPFGCPQCDRSFSRRSDLRKHTVVHTGIKPFTCTICLKSFSRNTNLTKHLRIHSGQKPYVCGQCPKTFISKGDLTRHALIHTGQRPFACNYCDQSFGRRDKLMRHEKRHFPSEAAKQASLNSNQSQADAALDMLRQQMDLWGSGAADEGIPEEETPAIKQEMADVEDRGQDYCEPEEDGCEDQESWSGENMVINVDPFGHEEGANIQNTDNKDESGAEEQDVLPRVPEHITGDSGFSISGTNTQQVKRYPCFVCHKRFTSADSLRHHMQQHSTEDKPHGCHLCPKSFSRKRELDRHIATHTGMKPFKCTNCDKKFGRKDKLVRHMRIHESREDKTLTCPICFAGFMRKDTLTQHLKTHSSVEDPPS